MKGSESEWLRANRKVDGINKNIKCDTLFKGIIHLYVKVDIYTVILPGEFGGGLHFLKIFWNIGIFEDLNSKK